MSLGEQRNVRGFVLVKCEPIASDNKDSKVCVKRISKVRGVDDAFMTSKPDADIVVFLKGKSQTEIESAISEIKSIPGVKQVKPNIEITA